MANRNVFAPLGASNHSLEVREDNDFYATDPIAVLELLRVFTPHRTIWEPACGLGHISETLLSLGYSVISTDLIDRGYGTGGVDFLSQTETFHGDIVTNPPYKLAIEFVQHALDIIEDGFYVIMLLRLNFLEGVARRKLFDVCPPRYVYVSSKRIYCCKSADFNPKQKHKNRAQAYAWFVWQKCQNYKDVEPVIRWFN